MKGRVVLALAVLGAAIPLLVFAGPGFADPSDLFVPQVPPHRHFVVKPDGTRVPVGPQVCEKPALMGAFEQFHFNIHHSFIPGVGPADPYAPPTGRRSGAAQRQRCRPDGDALLDGDRRQRGAWTM